MSPTPTNYYRQERRLYCATLNGTFDGNPFSADELLTELIGSFAINPTWGANVRVQFSRSVYQCWNPGGAGYRCQNMPLQAWDEYDVQSIASAVVGVKVGSHDLAALTLKQSEIPGCKPVTGTVTLTGAAPVGGVVVQLSDNLPATTLPATATVTVTEGLTEKTFKIASVPVTDTQNGTVSAKVGATIKDPAADRAPDGSYVGDADAEHGGWEPAGRPARRRSSARRGPDRSRWTCRATMPAVASPVAASIVVPQGLQSANFDVTTNAVQAKSYATISGTANGITKSKKLTVNVGGCGEPDQPQVRQRAGRHDERDR